MFNRLIQRECKYIHNSRFSKENIVLLSMNSHGRLKVINSLCATKKNPAQIATKNEQAAYYRSISGLLDFQGGRKDLTTVRVLLWFGIQMYCVTSPIVRQSL